ncbi:MAG: hypothetical protein QOE33_3043 [Acidobacteriota bacterium]|nr:hypothetical protein [Acidobacteriota bacterium]
MKTPFVTPIIRKLARKIGAKLIIEPEYGFVGHITFKNGKKTFFRSTNFNVNHLGSVEIARDKGYASFFLKKFGYRVPEGETFFSEKLCENLPIRRSIDDGFRYAQRLGFPVIIKPNNLSQGAFVNKVYNKGGYYRAARMIFKRTSVMLVQRFYSGKDYRIVVLGDEVISAYQRIPLYVIGNGKSTIKELLNLKQRGFAQEGRDTIIDVDDFRIKVKLQRQKLGLTSIPGDEEIIYLLDNANLSSGGDAVDLTKDIHPDFSNLAIGITKDMGLKLCGVDIITDDLTMPIREYVALEINGAPGLDNYASIGKRQAKVVEDLYLKVLRAIENGKDN